MSPLHRRWQSPVTRMKLVAGLLLDRMLNFDSALDVGGEWDEGGGVFTRWQ